MFKLDDHNTVEQQTILNIVINVVTEALARTFWTLTESMNIPKDKRPIINMKNESIKYRLPYIVIYKANLSNCWELLRDYETTTEFKRINVMV